MKYLFYYGCRSKFQFIIWNGGIDSYSKKWNVLMLFIEGRELAV